jgi:hypothetical protein
LYCLFVVCLNGFVSSHYVPSDRDGQKINCESGNKPGASAHGSPPFQVSHRAITVSTIFHRSDWQPRRSDDGSPNDVSIAQQFEVLVDVFEPDANV